MHKKPAVTTIPAGAHLCLNPCDAGWHFNTTECPAGATDAVVTITDLSPGAAADVRTLESIPTLNAVNELWASYGGSIGHDADNLVDVNEIPDEVMHAAHKAALHHLNAATLGMETHTRDTGELSVTTNPHIVDMVQASRLLHSIAYVGMEKTQLAHPDWDSDAVYDQAPFSWADVYEDEAWDTARDQLNERDQLRRSQTKADDAAKQAQVKERAKAVARAARVDQQLLRHDDTFRAPKAPAKRGVFARFLGR